MSQAAPDSAWLAAGPCKAAALMACDGSATGLELRRPLPCLIGCRTTNLTACLPTPPALPVCSHICGAVYRVSSEAQLAAAGNIRSH